MKRLIYLLSAVTLVACGSKETESELDAVKGVGLFKDGYLFALSSPNDPSDRCWYHNSVFKNPLAGADRQRDADALRNAQPLTTSSVTAPFLADLLSTRLQNDRNQQALASSLTTGACAVAGTLTMPNPAAKIGTVIFCTGLKETIFQSLKNASDAADKGSGSVDRLGDQNDRAVVNVPKDVINLFVNSLKK
ncbi:MAG: hypothetical protein HRU19_01500 [Pseudobacteriovorax sp.]|nr:hypothetical protein [Pseudobacteriovorax sp.]